MEVFELENEHGLKLIFAKRAFDYKGWLQSYKVKLVGKDIEVSMDVENPPYGRSPYTLFEEMNRQWSGWHDIKSWSAMESECSLSATHDATGHITLTLEIENRRQSWKAIAEFMIEAGRLSAVAAQAKSFFAG